MIGNNYPSNINFKIVQRTTAVSPDIGFNAVFEKIISDDENIFYIFRDPEISPGKFHAKLVDMPIPPGFKTAKGLSVNSAKKPILMPLMIGIKQGFHEGKEESHFCDEIHPLEAGTSCSQPLQNAASATYFTSSTPVPMIRGNEMLDTYVQAYNMINKGKTLYYLPTLTPNKTIQYIVFNDENKVKEFLKSIASKEMQAEKYIIGLNGFIIYVDQWDSSIFFDDFIHNKIKVPSPKLVN